MNQIKVMVNGIPGNVAVIVARHVKCDDGFELLPYSLTGPEITTPSFKLDDFTIRLVTPEKKEQTIKDIIAKEGTFITVDYTHPSAVNGNAEFYCQMNLPFVMGTTGGDRNRLTDIVVKSTIPAVIAPNMAKQIVGLQAMMAYAAENFPGIFKGYDLEIVESHQQGKADTSGTARAMVGYFNQMGVDFDEADIQMERDPEIQKTKWQIPEEHLKGHAWHTYTLLSHDKSVKLAFTHNINGRDVYSLGTLDAVRYLNQKLAEGHKGKVFSMIDVLKNI
ncbi:MAG: dihydrodipicolinate reductase [Proteobacteria bacterium]|nr:dihydrodipicolinate reductase [Pseudomonadota bacterium]